jgi:hypothetical protein
MEEIMGNYNIDGCVLLVEAIIKQAVQDYGKALKDQQKNPKNHMAEKMIRDCEGFFLKDVDHYMLDKNVAGPSTLESIRKQVFAKYRVCPAC